MVSLVAILTVFVAHAGDVPTVTVSSDSAQERVFNSTMTYYDILEVEHDATDEQIKAAFRRLAMRYHPDRNRGDAAAEAKFKLINEAHENLKDVQLRARYDRKLREGGTGSPYTRGFLRMTPEERTAFIEKWLWDDEGEPVLMHLISDLQAPAAVSVDAFHALLAILKHRHEHETNSVIAIRMAAFDALTKAMPHRPEIVEDYIPELSKIFAAKLSRDSDTQRYIGNEGGYYVGRAIETFFEDEKMDPEFFAAWLPRMGQMMAKSHSVAWKGLGKSLESLNRRLPQHMPAILKIYETALRDLNRPRIQPANRPEWRYGRVTNTVASGSGVAEGMLTIARLRPDLRERVVKSLLKYSDLFPEHLSTVLIRESRQDETAFKLLNAFLSKPYLAEQRAKLASTLEREEVNLRRNSRDNPESYPPARIESVQRILALIRGSYALNGPLRVGANCESHLYF